MYFGVFGEHEINSITLSGCNPVLIRIDEQNTLKNSYLYKDILHLNIKDILSYDYVTKDFLDNLMESFSKLNEFILRNEFDEIIVHCALGVSRSPAIMICISRILGNYQMEEIIKENFKNYNKVIVSEFEKYNFYKKNVVIDKLYFKGHFLEKYDSFDDYVNMNDQNLIDFRLSDFVNGELSKMKKCKFLCKEK